MTLIYAAFKPASRLSAPGHYDRLPYSPGPGAVPRRLLPLPRLESLTGALSSVARSRLREPSTTGSSWEEVVLGPISHWLGQMFSGGCQARIWGPLLRAGSGDEAEYYVNVGLGLLRLDGICVGCYKRLRDLAVEALYEARAMARARLRGQYIDLLEQIREKGCLVGSEDVISVETQVALDRARKAPRYGLLYSMAYLDYSTLASRLAGRLGLSHGLEIDVLVYLDIDCDSNSTQGITLEDAVDLRPMGIASLTVGEASGSGPSYRPGCIVSSPAPLAGDVIEVDDHGAPLPGDLAGRLVHPLDPERAPLTVYGRGFTAGQGFRKEEPSVAVHPGTLLDPNTARRIIEAPRYPGGSNGVSVELWYIV